MICEICGEDHKDMANRPTSEGIKGKKVRILKGSLKGKILEVCQTCNDWVTVDYNNHTKVFSIKAIECVL